MSYHAPFAIQLLKSLIEIPSFSGEEQLTAALLEQTLLKEGIQPHRTGNNVWALCPWFNTALPTVLLNSHHDTVKPNTAYTLDPHTPFEQDGKLYGLGSNDAGASLVCLLSAFLHFKNKPLPFNLAWLGSAEEENSGMNGVSMALPEMPEIYCGIVGEPTLLQPAIAEKGLMVIDATCHGKAGHAAREEGINALYMALEDIQVIRKLTPPKSSAWLGPVKITATCIQAGTQHNVVPATCQYTLDIRLNEHYQPEEILSWLQSKLQAQLKPRSTRLRPSFIPPDHPLVKACLLMDKQPYGSPTCSDQALMDFPTMKLGPGDSARSHTADEFVHLHEIEAGIHTYVQILENLKL